MYIFFYVFKLEDHEILPPCIIDIVGKTFKFGVDVVKDNITKGVAIYKVLKVWSIYNNLMVDSQSEAISDRVASTPSVDEVFCYFIFNVYYVIKFWYGILIVLISFGSVNYLGIPINLQ